MPQENVFFLEILVDYFEFTVVDGLFVDHHDTGLNPVLTNIHMYIFSDVLYIMNMLNRSFVVEI